MDFLKSIGETVNNAVDFVVEKNRKFTKTNRLKRLIKKESDSIIRSYITLGKHYYSDLRDVPDKEMQKICNNIDLAKLEIKKLKKHLLEVNTEQDYTKFRNLIDEEPVDSDVYNDDKCDCECDCDDEANYPCECESNLENSNLCSCDEALEKEKVILSTKKDIEPKEKTEKKAVKKQK